MNTRIVFVLVLSCATLGCMTEFKADPIGMEYQKQSATYFVQNHGDDGRRLDVMIAQELKEHGVQAISGYASDRPEQIDVLVEYTDKWQWDMSMYLINLEINMRDPQSNILLASGSSYQTSLARKPPAEVIAAIVTGILNPEKEKE